MRSLLFQMPFSPENTFQRKRLFVCPETCCSTTWMLPTREHSSLDYNYMVSQNITKYPSHPYNKQSICHVLKEPQSILRQLPTRSFINKRSKFRNQLCQRLIILRLRHRRAKNVQPIPPLLRRLFSGQIRWFLSLRPQRSRLARS